MDMFCKHYIEVDSESRIVFGWSDGIQPDRDTSAAFCINEQGGYQFRLFPDGEENPALYTMDGICRYVWDGEQCVLRSEDELDADRKAREPVLTPAQEREKAYNTLAVIQWDGNMITVTEAAQKWSYYAAEGKTDKTDALIILIAEAKQTIREKYPDVAE